MTACGQTLEILGELAPMTTKVRTPMSFDECHWLDTAYDNELFT